jgi:hypothetical protein
MNNNKSRVWKGDDPTSNYIDRKYHLEKNFKFALENKIKLIYSATSASLGNHGKDMNLSPYAFIKATNLQLLENLKKWFHNPNNL